MGALIQSVQDLLSTGCAAVTIGFSAVIAARHFRTILRILGINADDWHLPGE